MKSITSIRLSAKKGMMFFILCMAMMSIVHSQTITVNKQLFVGGTYPDSAYITVPIDLNTQGNNGFGYNPLKNSFDSNYFKLALIPVASANAVITDTSDAAINSLGGNIIGRYTFSNKQVPYTAFVNGMIPKIANGTVSSANYVLKVISTYPFVVSDATIPILYQKRTGTPKLKSLATIGANGSVFNYDPTHSAVFFGYCGAIVDSKGNPSDTTISIIDSTIGKITVGTGYDSVILIKNDYTLLNNTVTIVFADKISQFGTYNFPSGTIKAGNYYTLLMKSQDDNGYTSSKSYYVLNSFWNLNLAKKSSPNGCKGDTITLYPELTNIQAGLQFGIINNFPGFLYNVNWGDPKTKLVQNFSYSLWMNNTGMVQHIYDTSSCTSPSHYWTITAKLTNPFQGASCSFPIATPTVQIWSSVKAKYIHPKPVCYWNSVDNGQITFTDSSYGGTNSTCTGNAYYVWYKAYVGCGNINNAVFTAVDSSTTLSGTGTVIPSYVPHYDHKDTFLIPGKYMIKLIANNNTCSTNGYIDSIMVENKPNAKFLFDVAGVSQDTIVGCSPLTVAVHNLSDSTCTQKWNFNWDVTDAFGNAVPVGTYNILGNSTDFAPNVVFTQQALPGVYYLRLIGSNACTAADTVVHKVIVNGNGGVSFPNGNKSTHSANWFGKTNAFCIYNATGKTFSFDPTVTLPVSDAVVKPNYGGTPAAATPYSWHIVDINGTHTFNAGTDSTKQYPNVTFNTPANQDGYFLVYVTYSSTCGVSTDSFELYLNRQIIPTITIPQKDTSVCYGTSFLQFTGVVSPASLTTNETWFDGTNYFGNGLSATWNNVPFANITKTITFKAIKLQPDACPDTFATRRVTVLPIVNGRDTGFTTCSGLQLNYNPGLTSSLPTNTHTWTSTVIPIAPQSIVTGNTNCAGSCTTINDVLLSNGYQGEVDYLVTPINKQGCLGSTFTVRDTILPYPTIALSIAKDTICSGSFTNISVNTNIPGATYCWTAYPGSNLTPYNQGLWPAACGNTTTSNSGGTFNIAYTNASKVLDSVKIVYAISFASGKCSSPNDSITVSVIPGPTPPKANLGDDSIYACNASSVQLNSTIPAANENGIWTTSGTPVGVITPTNSPTATISSIAGGNVYTAYWSISNNLAAGFGCPPLTDSVKIFDRPLVTTANVGLDTVLCNYTGLTKVFIPLKGNTDPTRPYETGMWTVLDTIGGSGVPVGAHPGVNYYFLSGTPKNLLDTSYVPKDKFIFSGPSGTYTLIYTIYNDAKCAVSTDTFRIGAGFANDSILTHDTAFCKNTCLPAILGSIPSGGGGNYSYQWQSLTLGGPSGFTSIPGATSQNYAPPTQICPIATTQYKRLTSSSACPFASLPSNIMTISVHQPPVTGLISTMDTVCKGYTINNNDLKIDTTNYPVDPANVFNWYVNGVYTTSGTTFSTQGLSTINSYGSATIVSLVDSSLYGCGTDVHSHTYFTRIHPNPGFTASTLSSCNATDITFTDTTSNPGVYTGWHWDLGEGDVANTYQTPSVTYHYVPGTGTDSIYTVCLSAWNACQDTVKSCQTVKILAKPHASFYASTYSGCAPLLDSFYNTTIGQIDTAKWYWYYPLDTTNLTVVYGPNTGAPVIHTFPNTSEVVLKVYNQCGVDSTKPVNISVAFTAVKLTASPSHSDQYACAPHISDILYNAVGADKIDFWWYKINTTPPVVPNKTTFIPADIYSINFIDTGTFIVKVTASNPCTSQTVYDTIHMYLTPASNFKLVKSTVCVGDTVSPVNTTATPGVSYSWIFSQTGNTMPLPPTAAVPNPYTIFTNPGTDSMILGTTLSYPYPGPGFCSDTFKVKYTVVATQKASFTISNSTPSCLPATVTFTNNSPSSPTPPLEWFFNAPSVAAADINIGDNVATHTYTDTGRYIVALSTKSAGGCAYIDTEYVVVTSPYASVWRYDHGYICGATPVNFQVMNAAGVDSIYLWHFGDGTPAVSTPWNTPTVYHSYRNCGNYYPSVDLISKGGCKYSMSWNMGDTIKIDSVKAGFAFVNTNTNSCGSATFQFTDTSKACSGINIWGWNFGDIGNASNFSTIQNPSHTYFVSDKDTVQLQVTAVSGCTSTVNIPVNVKVNAVPQITTHVINPYNGVVGCTGQEITYTGTATCADPIKDYVWTFSNAPTVKGTTATNTYPAAGTYLDTLTVSTIFGCFTQYPGSVVVNQTPVIAINQTNPPQACRGIADTLSASSNDPVAGGTQFQWGPAIGYCLPSTANCSSYVVNASANSLIYVQGKASDGCTGYGDTVLLKVIQPITLSVTPTVDTICIGQSVQLNAVSVGATVFAWDSKDSSLTSDSITNPVATPKKIGLNIYTVRASNSCFEDSATISIAVGGYPSVVLGFRKGLDTIPPVQTGSTLPLSTYVLLSNDQFKTFAWTPSTGLNCNNCPDPIVTVEGSSLYSLKATTIYGCSGTDSMYLPTFCQNSQVYIPNAFSPDGDGKNDILMVRGSGIKIVKNFRIYNRWGQVVFERANFQVNDPQFGWDGKIRNTSTFSPPDVYVYYCEVLCDNDIPFTYKGNITLVK